ncbi:MAG: peptide deformylase [Gammaproteobacteria bacterium]
MRLKIFQTGHTVLRQQAEPLDVSTIRAARTQLLIELMRETMRDAPGVGLAAPQVGESLQLAVIEDRAELMAGLSPAVLAERERQPVPFHVIINPRLTITDPSPRLFFEGCLSVAGFVALTPRAQAVRVECLNEQAQPVVIDASGWYARILQHEIDHLHGKLCLDCMLSRSFMNVENYQRYWADQPISQVLSELGLDAG